MAPAGEACPRPRAGALLFRDGSGFRGEFRAGAPETGVLSDPAGRTHIIERGSLAAPAEPTDSETGPEPNSGGGSGGAGGGLASAWLRRATAPRPRRSSSGGPMSGMERPGPSSAPSPAPGWYPGAAGDEITPEPEAQARPPPVPTPKAEPRPVPPAPQPVVSPPLHRPESDMPSAPAPPAESGRDGLGQRLGGSDPSAPSAGADPESAVMAEKDGGGGGGEPAEEAAPAPAEPAATVVDAGEGGDGAVVGGGRTGAAAVFHPPSPDEGSSGAAAAAVNGADAAECAEGVGEASMIETHFKVAAEQSVPPAADEPDQSMTGTCAAPPLAIPLLPVAGLEKQISSATLEGEAKTPILVPSEGPETEGPDAQAMEGSAAAGSVLGEPTDIEQNERRAAAGTAEVKAKAEAADAETAVTAVAGAVSVATELEEVRASAKDWNGSAAAEALVLGGTLSPAPMAETLVLHMAVVLDEETSAESVQAAQSCPENVVPVLVAEILEAETLAVIIEPAVQTSEALLTAKTLAGSLEAEIFAKATTAPTSEQEEKQAKTTDIDAVAESWPAVSVGPAILACSSADTAEMFEIAHILSLPAKDGEHEAGTCVHAGAAVTGRTQAMEEESTATLEGMDSSFAAPQSGTVGLAEPEADRLGLLFADEGQVSQDCAQDSSPWGEDALPEQVAASESTVAPSTTGTLTANVSVACSEPISAQSKSIQELDLKQARQDSLKVLATEVADAEFTETIIQSGMHSESSKFSTAGGSSEPHSGTVVEAGMTILFGEEERVESSESADSEAGRMELIIKLVSKDEYELEEGILLPFNSQASCSVAARETQNFDTVSEIELACEQTEIASESSKEEVHKYYMVQNLSDSAGCLDRACCGNELQSTDNNSSPGENCEVATVAEKEDATLLAVTGAVGTYSGSWKALPSAANDSAFKMGTVADQSIADSCQGSCTSEDQTVKFESTRMESAVDQMESVVAPANESSGVAHKLELSNSLLKGLVYDVKSDSESALNIGGHESYLDEAGGHSLTRGNAADTGSETISGQQVDHEEAKYMKDGLLLNHHDFAIKAIPAPDSSEVEEVSCSLTNSQPGRALQANELVQNAQVEPQTPLQDVSNSDFNIDEPLEQAISIAVSTEDVPTSPLELSEALAGQDCHVTCSDQGRGAVAAPISVNDLYSVSDVLRMSSAGNQCNSFSTVNDVCLVANDDEITSKIGLDFNANCSACLKKERVHSQAEQQSVTHAETAQPPSLDGCLDEGYPESLVVIGNMDLEELKANLTDQPGNGCSNIEDDLQIRTMKTATDSFGDYSDLEPGIDFNDNICELPSVEQVLKAESQIDPPQEFDAVSLNANSEYSGDNWNASRSRENMSKDDESQKVAVKEVFLLQLIRHNAVENESDVKTCLSSICTDFAVSNLKNYISSPSTEVPVIPLVEESFGSKMQADSQFTEALLRNDVLLSGNSKSDCTNPDGFSCDPEYSLNNIVHVQDREDLIEDPRPLSGHITSKDINSHGEEASKIRRPMAKNSLRSPKDLRDPPDWQSNISTTALSDAMPELKPESRKCSSPHDDLPPISASGRSWQNGRPVKPYESASKDQSAVINPIQSEKPLSESELKTSFFGFEGNQHLSQSIVSLPQLVLPRKESKSLQPRSRPGQRIFMSRPKSFSFVPVTGPMRDIRALQDSIRIETERKAAMKLDAALEKRRLTRIEQRSNMVRDEAKRKELESLNAALLDAIDQAQELEKHDTNSCAGQPILRSRSIGYDESLRISPVINLSDQDDLLETPPLTESRAAAAYLNLPLKTGSRSLAFSCGFDSLALTAPK